MEQLGNDLNLQTLLSKIREIRVHPCELLVLPLQLNPSVAADPSIPFGSGVVCRRLRPTSHYANPGICDTLSCTVGDRPVDDPFAAGSVVIVTLNMPREKFWGTLLALTPAGASLRGIDLNSLEDFARQVRDGDRVSANIVFFPMHRIERIESDSRNGDIPSLQERFENKSGRDFRSLAAAD